jgi:hypothetical protein
MLFLRHERGIHAVRSLGPGAFFVTILITQ